ncbi:hypothetical protein PENTCL1PPCAC_9332 [Pristionchus entomophagus]|uniref:Uncharacterized protein n=1 Tax=Pristionchus entomophagus TaxID=358040 RepID=A0AAV5SWL8_9BILA|nr:hypothetical protein PENTCL1PPCAC_9332 [Pristionchus entomophagus]
MHSRHWEFIENDPLNDNFEFDEVEKDVFKNSTLKTPGGHGNRHTYGGLLCAHSLTAADKTVPVDLNCHSFQCNFILQVDSNIPVFYHVSRLFDGRSFATRLVECKQEGTLKFAALVAYQKYEPHAIEHQSEMPVVPEPEDCEEFDTAWAFHQAWLAPHRRTNYDKIDFADPHRPKVFQAFETRCTDSRDFHTTTNKTDKHYFWTRYKFPLDGSSRLHAATLLYISDNSNNLIVFNAHTREGFQPAMSFSLNHTIYFHGRQIDANEWMLIELESTNAAHGRGLTRGRIWSKQGDMIASISQEVVVRKKESKEAKL